jgi:hypothetical protein
MAAHTTRDPDGAGGHASGDTVHACEVATAFDREVGRIASGGEHLAEVPATAVSPHRKPVDLRE